MDKKFKNFISFILIFFINISFTNLSFKLLESNDYSIALQGLSNLIEDLGKIGFNPNFDINYYRFSYLIAFFLTLFGYFSIFKKKKINYELDNIFKLLINLFFINSATFLSFIYIFRFFYFPRFYIILNLFLYPLLLIIFYIFYYKIIEPSDKLKLVDSLIIITFISVSVISIMPFNNQNRVTISNTLEISDNDLIEAVDKELNPSLIAENLNENLKGSIDCFKWSGSDQEINCLETFDITLKKSYGPEYINNFVKYGSDFFTVFKSGTIIKNEKSLFLDISYKVNFTNVESGLFDIEFHPTENYFLISYVNSENNLIVEKFISNEKDDYETGEIIFELPNANFNHYCGSLEWSQFFNSFLLCVGDMGDENNSLDTTSEKGKILVLPSKNISSPLLISDSSNREVLNNLVAFGLRNPWNFKESDGKLIVPDVGNKSSEELNIVNLEELNLSLKPYLFGWPIYEGNIINDKNFYGIKLWDEKEVDVYGFVKENVVQPSLYYDRPAPENNRTAIIGTIIYKNENSKFNDHIIFSDFLSKEIFIFDYKNNILNILNIPPFPGVLTALGEHPQDKNKIIFSISDGDSTEVYDLTLP